MNKIACSLLVSLSILCLTVGRVPANAADLVWQTSRLQALDIARQQGKKILLLAGRET